MTDIPEKHQSICKALARVAREQGLTSLTATYRPGFRDEWPADITLTWEAGRHEEAADKINISSQLRVHTKIDAPSS